MRKSSHLDRAELIESITLGDAGAAIHFKQCEQCRTLSSIMKWVGLEKGEQFWEPSDELLHRCKGIARLVQSRKPGRTIEGSVVFDSWGSRPALAIRQAPLGLERRLRFAAGSVILEIVGNRSNTGWEFVARAYVDGQATRRFILQVGSKKLHARTGDCYFWTSRGEPHSFKLLSRLMAIDLGRVRW